MTPPPGDLIQEINNLKALIDSMKMWLRSIPVEWMDHHLNYESLKVQMMRDMKEWLLKIPPPWLSELDNIHPKKTSSLHGDQDEKEDLLREQPEVVVVPEETSSKGGVKPVEIKEEIKEGEKKDDDVKKASGVGALGTFKLLPTPTPNVMAAFISILVWIGIFSIGCSALFSIQGPKGFVDKGLTISKEY